jgi:hypothetical protein
VRNSTYMHLQTHTHTHTHRGHLRSEIGRRNKGEIMMEGAVTDSCAMCAMSVVRYLNTMMCSLCSAPNAVGGVRVLPSRKR